MRTMNAVGLIILWTSGGGVNLRKGLNNLLECVSRQSSLTNTESRLGLRSYLVCPSTLFG